MANKCPNCGGRNDARAEDAVLCQSCFDSCPMGPQVAKDMEETFRSIMSMGVKIPGVHPYGKDWK